MGCYINPPGESKESWPVENAVELPRAPRWEDFSGVDLPVCLVNNGLFTAAGVCYSERELAAFSDPQDRRPKRWFKARVEDLELVAAGLKSYLKRGN